MASIRNSAIFLFLFLYVNVTCPLNAEEKSNTSDRFVESDPRLSWDSEDESLIWMEYEFDTGAGNREELVVTNVSVHEQTSLPNTRTNWQFLDANGTSFLFRTDKSTLWLHKFDLEKAAISDPVELDVEGKILTFKVISLYPESDVMAVLCVETNSEISLRWYRFVDEKFFRLFYSWPVQKRIKDVQFIRHEESKKLLLLGEEEVHFGLRYSPIDVYGFSIDFSTNAFYFWLYQRTFMPTAFDIQVCSMYESIFLALRSTNDVFLYEYRNTTRGSIFREFQTIKSHDLKNFVCFESGYLQFVAISGPEAALFHFEDEEFRFNVESEPSFDLSDISWIKDLKLSTYRDESLLLIQLKNSTVIALAWQGLSFKRIDLPDRILDGFDLSMITPLPKFGFALGNKFVKFHTELKNVKHPFQHTAERLLALQRLLNDSLNRQERILDETKAIFEKSYLENPVITGVWNLGTVNATNAVISNDVTFRSVTIGSIDLTKEELELDANYFEDELRDLKQKLDEIDSNLRNAVDSDTAGLTFDADVEIFGNINITGNLSVENLRTVSLNDIDTTRSTDPIEDREEIEHRRTYDSVEAANLTVRSLNGVPIESIRFGNVTERFDNVDFSRINRARVGGHVSFSTINGIRWKNLMESIVWKNGPMLISGNTIIEGTVIADIIDSNVINELAYPEDYVTTDRESTVTVQGSKSFDALITSRLENVGTLNGIDFEDFVILHKSNVLKEEITFENLLVEGPLQVDGKIEGLETRGNPLLNETSKISSDVSFINLNVLGNLTFDTLFMNKRPLNLRDLLLKNDENVEIVGTKTFLGNVEMKFNVTITSGKVNGHFLDEFATMDTDQDFPNLTKISPDVSFGNVTFGAMKQLEAFLDENKRSDDCLQQIIVFKSPLTIDRLSFDKLSSDVSYEHFAQKLNEAVRNVVVENLTVESLIAQEITPRFVNGMDFPSLTDHLESSNIVGEYAVDNLETEHLDASSVNGMSLEEIKRLKDRVGSILEIIRNGNVTLDTLGVTGTIKSSFINGEVLADLYKGDRTATMLFKKGVSIKKLTILGSINGYNFSESVSDTALKTDTNITIDGYKIFDNINCHVLDATSLNGRPLQNILDPSKEQVLSGPVGVNGSITILQEFNATGNIGAMSFRNLMERFESLGNDTFRYHGDLRLSDNVTIENLYTNGSIQDRNIDSFLKSVILKVEDNVTVSGTKVFRNSVAFHDAFVVRDKLNDIDLRRFHEKAVFVNEPFSLETKLFLKDGIKIEAGLTVKTGLETKSVVNVDVNELKLDVLYLNRPSYIEETTTLTDASFQSDIRIETFNDLDTKLLIPLNTEQIISVEALKCRNVTVDRLKILGQVNGEELTQIQRNTFTVIGDQNVTGHFHFLGDAHVRRNFDSRLLNGIDSTKFISLKKKGSIVGNLSFENPIHFDQTLRVLSYLNGIDPARWEAVAVTANNSFRQIISGRWSIFGNVFFEKGAFGSDVLNGTDVTEVSHALANRRSEMDDVLTEKDTNLESVCEDLSRLKHYAENQVYRFDTFDYLKVIDFDYRINSVHYFELDDLDYLMLSFNTCNVHTYLFTGTRFELVANVPDFGEVEKWTTFKHDRTLYFLTRGPNSCGRGPANLWKLKNDEFEHVLDLGRDINADKIDRKTFSMLLDREDRPRTVGGLDEELERYLSSVADDDDAKIVLEEDQMLLTSKHPTYEYNFNRFSDTHVGKYIGRPEALNFKAGLLEKEMFLYYDEEVSKDRIFICSNDATRKKILQTIKAHRPSSFAILNFEGSIQTLLIFVENRKSLRIYEYKGTQGFVYKDSIGTNVDGLISFTIRKYTNLARRHCLAILHDNRLTLLEAKMYGDKLDASNLTCSEHRLL